MNMNILFQDNGEGYQNRIAFLKAQKREKKLEEKYLDFNIEMLCSASGFRHMSRLLKIMSYKEAKESRDKECISLEECLFEDLDNLISYSDKAFDSIAKRYPEAIDNAKSILPEYKALRNQKTSIRNAISELNDDIDVAYASLFIFYTSKISNLVKKVKNSFHEFYNSLDV
jgi:hypothetical protein